VTSRLHFAKNVRVLYTDTAAEVTIGDDADAADDFEYPIPNEESGCVTPDTGPEVKF